ncbi:MAG: glycosyltransferase family 2 protein [Candidatus Geothermincolales bacterium]
MNEKATISFIVVNRNGEGILGRCLDSIFSQDLGEPYEVVVVDDASTDGSVELVRASYPRARLVEMKRNRGPAAAKNVGAAVARGEVLAFLDNDVALEKSWARSMLSVLRSDPRVGACASHILFEKWKTFQNSTGGLVNLLGYAWERGIYLPDSRTYSLNRWVTYACSAAMAVRRDVFDSVGGFDPHYFYLYEDVDLGWRINLAGYRVVYVPEARAFHRLSATMGPGRRRNEYLSVRNRIYTLLKNLEASTLRMVLREALYRLFYDGAFFQYGNGEGKLKKVMVPCRALFWNLLGLPRILRWRRSMRSTRKIRDSELIASGILIPTLVFPEIGKDPRLSGVMVRDLSNGPAPRRLWIGKRKCGGLVYGWYQPEKSASGLSFRWTGERAGFRLRASGRDKVLYLVTLSGNPEGGSVVEVWIDGYKVGDIRVGGGLAVHRLPLPLGGPSGGKGKEWRGEIRVINPFVPAKLGVGLDGRSLGIGVVAVGTSKTPVAADYPRAFPSPGDSAPREISAAERER